MVGCSILLYNRRANTMDGVSLSYTRMASAISGGLRMHAGTRLGRLLTVLNSLLKLITVLGSSAYRKALLNSPLKLITVLGSSAFQKSSLSGLLKLITVLGSSAFQKALTRRKRAGRVGPWGLRLPEVNTSYI